MRSLGVICARAGSKRLPGKNLVPLNGAPLIAYVCRAAKASRLDRVIVSTEDDGIAEVAAAHGVDAPFRRPQALVADYASSPDILGHALDWMTEHEAPEPDIVMLLQPTTPFVLPVHIDACLDAVAAGAASAITARRTSEPPQWMFVKDADGNAQPLLGAAIEGEGEHHQHVPPSWFPTGAAYAMRVSEFRRQAQIFCTPMHLVEMPPERSVDIDDALGLAYAETVAHHHGFTPIGIS